jgi:RNA polymerase sigma-70 factor (ECF subfamily)
MSVQVVTAERWDLSYQRAFERHWEDVFRFALAWTNDWAAAEDLAQDAYLRLWQQRGSLDWQRPVLPWLLVVTRRLATDRFRVLRRRILPRSTALALDEAVRDRWLDAQVAMALLSPLERSALVLTAVEGWTYAEVALALGTSDGALRAAVSRARAKLEVA